MAIDNISDATAKSSSGSNGHSQSELVEPRFTSSGRPVRSLQPPEFINGKRTAIKNAKKPQSPPASPQKPSPSSRPKKKPTLSRKKSKKTFQAIMALEEEISILDSSSSEGAASSINIMSSSSEGANDQRKLAEEESIGRKDSDVHSAASKRSSSRRGADGKKRTESWTSTASYPGPIGNSKKSDSRTKTKSTKASASQTSTPESQVSSISTPSTASSTLAKNPERLMEFLDLTRGRIQSHLSSFSASTITLKSLEAWEQECCSSLFSSINSMQFKNPDSRYIALKTGIYNTLSTASTSSEAELVKSLFKKYNNYSKASIVETFAIMQEGGLLSETGAAVPILTDTKKQLSKKDVLKKEDFRKQSQPPLVQEAKKSTLTLASGKKPVASQNPFQSKKQKRLAMAAELDETDVLLKTLQSIPSTSARRRKVRTEDGEWIEPHELEGRTIENPSQSTSDPKTKRKRKSVKEGFDESFGVFGGGEDPFRLILLNDYETTEQATVEEGHFPAPFKVQIKASVIILMDLHAHLHRDEIIGLLGGELIVVKPKASDSDEQIPAILRISEAYACMTSHSTGTQVDVDPLSEMAAGEYFDERGLRMTGWYHSHPNFEPNPSLRDLETQSMYQGLFKGPKGDDASNYIPIPFVGIIVNPYLAITESSSHIECFHIPDVNNEEKVPYRLSFEIIPFEATEFDSLLGRLKGILERASFSPDWLDLEDEIVDAIEIDHKKKTIKRRDKLLKSLKHHCKDALSVDQFNHLLELFKVTE